MSVGAWAVCAGSTAPSSSGEDGGDQIGDYCLVPCSTGSMPDVPLTRKQLQCVICARLSSTLGNLTHQSRTCHLSSSSASALRRSALAPRSSGEPDKVLDKEAQQN